MEKGALGWAKVCCCLESQQLPPNPEVGKTLSSMVS